MTTDLISHISADDSEGEIETHEVTLTPGQPDEPFMNLVEELPEEDDEADEEDFQNTTISTKGLRELRNLTTYYNPDPLQYTDNNNHAAILATFENPPEVALQATPYDGNPDPKTYHEAKMSFYWPSWWDSICT
jgi:hypothetical protein